MAFTYVFDGKNGSPWTTYREQPKQLGCLWASSRTSVEQTLA
jgi:hypothetical protein